MRKFIALLLMLALCLAALSGCGGGSSDPVASTGEPKDSITIISYAEPATLDPSKANNQAIGVVNRWVMEGLYDFDAEGGVENWLVEESHIEGEKTLYIKLKEGILFSDGTELTSEDVLWHLTRTAVEPVSASQFGFIDCEKSHTVDKYNLVVEFKQAWAPYMVTLATQRGFIPSKAAYEAMGEENFARAPIGTGPYKVDEWVSGSYVTLSANEHYHGGDLPIKNVTIKFIPEAASRVIEMENGQADFVLEVQASDIARVNDIDGYHVEMGDSYTYYILCLSMQEELFQDPRVREALMLAIDKEALVKSSTDGTGTLINSFGPPLMIEGAKEYSDLMEHNVEKAKQLLAEAGFPNGFTIDLHIETSTLYQRLAVAIQGMWSEIGVTANVVESKLATYDAEHNGHFQASLRNGGATEPSGVWTIYESSFGSRMNGNDDWLDAKLLELRTHYAGDPEREAILEEISDHLDEIKFSYPIMVTPTVYGVSDKLEGFIFSPTVAYLDIWNWVVYQ